LDSVVDDDYALIRVLPVRGERILPVAYDRLPSLLGRARCMLDLWRWTRCRDRRKRLCCGLVVNPASRAVDGASNVREVLSPSNERDSTRAAIFILNAKMTTSDSDRRRPTPRQGCRVCHQASLRRLMGPIGTAECNGLSSSRAHRVVRGMRRDSKVDEWKADRSPSGQRFLVPRQNWVTA
jgi:hypothetical protein